MYEIRLLPEASRNLAHLDKPVAGRVLQKLNWLGQNAEVIKPKGLRENLSGLAKLRVGDYRIIYQTLEEEKVVIVHFIGHRRDVYKDR